MQNGQSAESGHIADNILQFGRLLRASGLPVGPGTILEAVRAISTAGFTRRDDFYWCLFAVFVNRQDQRAVFDQAFHLFWRNPKLLERMLNTLLPHTPFADRAQQQDANGQDMIRRLSEALGQSPDGRDSVEGDDKLEVDATFTFSDRELLQEMDFESMSNAELEMAKAAIQRLRLPLMLVPTRRTRPDPHGRRIDMRASLRASLRANGEISLKYRARQRRHPPLVVLCDISGSMSLYSRMFLHFMHAVTNDRDRVHTFVFGTRLTNITRYLRNRDVDIALGKVSENVLDWSGGTRIGSCLKDFNQNWSRRVLGQGAVTIIISDGLDRDAGQGMAHEVDRLHRSCRRLIWLNPLLRYDGFQPKSRGIQAMLPHVDDFRTIHNLNSLMDLATILSAPATDDRDKLSANIEAMQ